MKSKPVIKRMKNADYAETLGLLCRVFNSCAAELTSTFNVAADWEDNKPTTFIVKAGPQTIGAVAWRMAREEDPELGRGIAMGWLAVDEAWRHKGIGRRLVAHFEAHTRAVLKGGKGLICLIDGTKENNPASRFYENMGYILEKSFYDSIGRDIDVRTSGDGLPCLVKPFNMLKVKP